MSSISALEMMRSKIWRQQNTVQMKKGIFEREIIKANQELYYNFKVKQAFKIMKKADKIFHGKLAVAFSGGKDSLVALHLALKVNPEIPVIFSNTTVNFPEAIKYARYLQSEWSFNLHFTKPETSFFKAVQEKGWATHENRWCCKPFKEIPTLKFLEENDINAEITGTTRNESIYRRSLKPFTYPKKERLQIIRVNPIYDWNYWEVWKYIKQNELPYNPLYDMGYRRIGCWCCPLNGPSHYRRLRKTHPRLFSFLRNFTPPHPTAPKI